MHVTMIFAGDISKQLTKFINIYKLFFNGNLQVDIIHLAFRYTCMYIFCILTLPLSTVNYGLELEIHVYHSNFFLGKINEK